MKTPIQFPAFCGLLTALCVPAFAQGTAFTYQGHLTAAGNPANGIYDVSVTVYDAPTNGDLLAGPLTNSATGITNGLFGVTLDFGPGVFTGPERWLQLAVRTNGGGAFTPLAPLQAVQTVPYAIMAGVASNLLGALPSAQLAGAYNSPVSFNNGADSFDGTFTGEFLGAEFLGGSFSGNFFGNGANLINLSAGQLTGTVPGGQLAGPYTNGVAFSNPGNTFTGSFTGGGAGLTGLNASQLSSGVIPLAQLPGGVLTNDAANVTLNGSLTLTNLTTPSPQSFVLQAGNPTHNGYSGNGGDVDILAGWAGTGTGGSGGNLNLIAGSAVPYGGSGYYGLGPAGNVTIQAGGGYNNTGGNVVINSGDPGPWNQTPNAFSTVTLQGGIAAESFAASMQIESGHNEVVGSEVFAGGNVTLTAGTAWGGYAGGNIVLLPGAGTPNGNVGIGKNNPATLLDVNGTVTATNFIGNGTGLTGLSVPAANVTGQLTLAQLPGAVLTNGASGVVFSGTLTGNGAGLTNLNASQLSSGVIPPAQLPGGLLTNNASNVTFNGSFTITNLITPSTQNFVLQAGNPTDNGYSGNGGNVSILAGNAGTSTGGAGGNLNLAAGNAVAYGGSGYYGLGPAGNVSILAGGGYNSPGGNVVIQSGANSNWTLTNNLFSKISLLGGTLLGTDGAGLTVEGAHNGSTVNAALSYGGNITLTGGTGYGGLSGGNINLLPGTPNGNVGIGKSNPATLLDVNGTVTAASFAGNGAGLTNLNAAQLSGGTIPLAQLPGAVLTNGAGAVTLTGTFSGNGAGLTNLNTMGTNVALLNGTNRFTGTNTFAYLAGNGAGLTNVSVPAANLTGAIALSQLAGVVLTNNATNVTFNGSLSLTNLITPSTQNFVLQAGNPTDNGYSGNGGNVSILAGNAGTSTGGSGGNLNLVAGSAVPYGGSGYYGLGPAGNVSILAGGGYNSPGGNVVIQSGGNSNWTLTNNLFTKISLLGGTLLGTDGAGLTVEGAHNGSTSNGALSYGGNVTITGGTGYGGLPGGSILLLPGAGSPNGYVGIGTSAPAYPLQMASGAYCSAAGVWTSVSDRNVKEDFTAITPGDVLAKVAALPITQWKYKVEPDGIKHLGPVAQDFHAAFGLGESDKAIGTVDESGVALAAIQGLNQKLDEKAEEINALKQQNDSLAKQLRDLAAAVQALAEKK